MKKCIVICMTALSLSCLAAGCGKQESRTPENNYPVESTQTENSVGKNAESTEDDNITSDKEDHAADSETAGDNNIISGKEDQATVSSAAEDDNVTSSKEDQATVSGAAGGNGDQAERQADNNTGQKESVSGIIKEISEQYISVSLAHEGNINGEIIHSISDEEQVKIYYDENTIFKKKTVRNGGVDPANDVSVTDAAAQDMKIDMMINLEGKWDGEIYHADVVSLYQFL